MTEGEEATNVGAASSGSASEGILYVLTNERMPDLVKIGIVERGSTAADLQKRVTEISGTTGVPLPFEVHYAVRLRDPRSLERKLSRLFGEERVNPRREFFEVDPEKAVIAIGIGNHEELVTVETGAEDAAEQAALEKAKSRRPRINMMNLGLNAGDELTFTRDDTIKATVADGTRIEFEGQTITLSAAAGLVLGRMGRSNTSVAGSQYWAYNGETLEALRHRLEHETFEE